MQKYLINPNFFQKPNILKKINPVDLKKMLKLMTIIRKTEQQLAVARKNKLIGGPVHLGVGQEAIAVGISQNLNKTDRVFGAHRSHSHLLSLNPNFYKLFAEVLGKKNLPHLRQNSKHFCYWPFLRLEIEFRPNL